MSIMQRVEEGTVIITICGNPLSEMDLAPLKRSVRSHANSGNKHIVLDFGRVAHMNSCTIGSLLAVRKIVEKCDGTLLLTRMNRNLTGILSRTGLLKHFRICSSTEDALARMSA